MPWIHRTVFLGHDIALFLPDPNWAKGVEIVYKKETLVEAGQTGRENRSAKYSALRHEITGNFQLAQADALALQQSLYLLGTPVEGDRVYVGVPIWPDQLPLARWAEIIHDAQWVVSYDSTGYDILPASEVANATRDWVAPFLVGRLDQRPKLTSVSDLEARFSLKILERSPWDFRIQPAVQAIGDGSTWPESLQAHWKTLPDDWTEDTLVYEDSGAGRVEAVDGQEGTVRRGQQFLIKLDGRDQIRTLIAFFLNREGRVKAFDAPWLLQPGDDVPEAPHTTKARFSEDSIKITYKTDASGEAKVPMIQVPWEISGIAGEQPEQSSIAYLYRFWVDVPGGPVYWRFTNWEHDLQRAENSQQVTYQGDTRALFRHDKITQTIDLSDDPTSLGSWLFDGNPLLRIIQRRLDVPLHLEIYRTDPANTAAAKLIYLGEVADAENEGRRLTSSTQVLGGMLEMKVPNFFFGPVCNYKFCGPGCNTLGSMPPEHWTLSGTIVSQVGNVLTVQVTNNPCGATLTADYLAKAWLKTGEGEAFQLRQIVRSADAGSGSQRFTLKKPLRDVQVGASVTFRPYCSGTQAECDVKFNNYINMGAHPHIAPRNLSVPSREVNTPTGKK
ncbi:MAG: phage BR0599 family protein [Opitutaceae bacterium]|jgi:hypothetical protein